MANANIIQIYSRNRERLAFLQNAFAISYKKTLNSLWIASFSLPSDDSKNAHCRPFNLVELYDGDERVELFRIVGEDLTRSTQAITVYTCEHVLATLIDDVMFQYHQIGNLGVYTPSVIRYVLDLQTEKNWKLGICGFSRQFEYKWENENLLSALFSIAKPFTEAYIWDFDTSAYPWTLNLRPLSEDVKSEIRYGKNMAEVTKTVDATNVITRLYCLGYGEGDNQLDIRSVNNGVPYLDAPTIPTWGIKASILADRRFEDAASLKAYGQQILNAACEPYVTYSAQAVDLYKLTGQRYDKFVVGDMVRVIDKADGIDGAFPIIDVEKTDITGSPGAVSLTIANKGKNLSESITDLQNRALINDLYAQGATNQVMVSFADNADKDNPALLKLYVPESMVRVNSCVLNFEFEPFRAYEKGVASAAQQTQTTSSTNSTYQSSSTESSQTKSSSTESSKITSTSTESAKYTSTSNGGGAQTTSGSVTLDARNVRDESNGGYGSANHNHGISQGTHLITDVRLSGSPETGYSLDYRSVGWAPSGAHEHAAHSHSVSVPSHDHDVTIPSHGHSVTIPSHGHTVNIPGHNHTVNIPGHNHSVTIPAHGHAVEYGIFKTGGANAGRLYVNGKYVREVKPNTNIELAALLADSKGKIARNTFHRIEIYPVAATNNVQGLTRIVANIFMQIFTNSRGSGDY